MRHHYVARTVRGIEHVVAAEITDRRFGSVDAVRHREVWFRGFPDAVRLRTADDLVRVLAVVDDIGPTKAALTTLADAAAELVSLPDKEVDVTASFLGRRNYNRYDIEDTVGRALEQRLRLRYHPRRAGRHRPRCGATVRVTIEDKRAMIGLRVLDRPLHQRDYRTVSRPGASHPPLAAAMCRLADNPRSLLDPCCGVGTIPIEARALGVQAMGTDVEPAAIRAAATNEPRLHWSVADAGRLPLTDGGVAAVVTNPPWGGQVSAGGLPLHRFWAEVRRVLTPEGRAVVLMPEPERWLPDAERAGLRARSALPVRLHGASPSIVVFD
ncbi:methyltransferase domain-containing protein [Actinocrispum wychmicini]|uniref:tRNA G10 N-methylase Trm11 n=1 Tax=Actinocrispum wychmicini TaxID=1213861 RepID=A0A4V2S602_9PSEU|nr:methyltransferase domain-containing protein [Actinocrispum wychmicini]TCO54160.1 tRNA G10 N-methylase Trm11 [Actinocrispum wychmicini]